MSTKKQFMEEIPIPENVTIELNGNIINIKGPNGENKLKLMDPKIKLKKEDNKIFLTSNKNRKEKTSIMTSIAHINNNIQGVLNFYIYTLKICSSHFPMTVSVSNNNLIIKNFLAEKIPRKAKILPNVDVKIDGNNIIVKSLNKEAAGQTAANMEQACRITDKDRRIFMDGIYITKKPERIK